MEILVAAVVAAAVGALGPKVVRRLPEPAVHPDDPPQDEPKIPYADLGSSPRTEVTLALVAALLAAVGTATLDLPALLPALVVFCGVGTWLAWVDWRTRLLPFLITAPLHLLVLVLVAGAALLQGDVSVLRDALVANVVVFAVFWLIWFVGGRVGSTFGYGDVRLSGIIGLLLGPLGVSTTVAGLYAGFVLGAVGGIALSRLGIVDRKGFAFGPYMVIGAIVGLLVPAFW